MLIKLYLYFIVVLFGACIGSFINVVVYRLPRGTFFDSTRSRCPACNEALRARDLVPVLSYLVLNGRCRYCGGKISPRYPAVETLGALLAVLCFARFGTSFRSAYAFYIAVILLCIALIDYDTMEIPDRLVLLLSPFALGAIWCFPDVSPVSRIIGFFAVSLPMLLMALAINGSFGGGDIKLMAVCGFLLGWKSLLCAFFIALLLGGGYSLCLIFSGRAEKGSRIAFGPYLCIGVFTAFLWGGQIMSAYLGLFGIVGR